MSAILEIPEVRRRVSPLSVQEYHRLEEFNESGRRTELIRGIVIEKMSKSPLHRIITSRLYKLFLARLPGGFYQEKRLLGVNKVLECSSVPGVRIRIADLLG